MSSLKTQFLTEIQFRIINEQKEKSFCFFCFSYLFFGICLIYYGKELSQSEARPMWLFNRKNKRKDDFEMEETFYSESVEVDSDSDEEAYHQIADIITGHSERIRQLLESYFDNPDLLIEELREDDVDWNDEFADLLEQAQDDYWLLMLLTLEKESYATQIYWRDNASTLASKLPKLRLLKGIAQQELQTCSVECSLSEYLECVSAKLQEAGIA